MSKNHLKKTPTTSTTTNDKTEEPTVTKTNDKNADSVDSTATAHPGDAPNINTRVGADIEKTTQGHFEHNTSDSGRSSPMGLAPSSNDRATQGNVFDAIESLDDNGAKAVCHSALAYRAGFALIMGAHSLLRNNGFDTRKADDATDETSDKIRSGMLRNAAMFNFCRDEGFTVAMSPFEQPQSLDDIFASALKQNAKKVVGLSKEDREMMGISEAEAEHLEAAARRRAEITAKAIGDSLEEHKHEVKAIILNMLDNVGNDRPDDRFDIPQHAQLFETVIKSLDRNRARSVTVGMEYDGDFRAERFADARELNFAVKAVEKSYTAFRRANLSELRDAA